MKTSQKNIFLHFLRQKIIFEHWLARQDKKNGPFKFFRLTLNFNTRAPSIILSRSYEIWWYEKWDKESSIQDFRKFWPDFVGLSTVSKTSFARRFKYTRWLLERSQNKCFWRRFLRKDSNFELKINLIVLFLRLCFHP